MKISTTFFVSILSIFSAATSAVSCDLCGCYTPSLEAASEKRFSFYTGVAEQFTYFDTDRQNGQVVSNPTGQYLASSITQIVPGVTFFQNRLSVQFNIPLIYRQFQRPVGFDIQHGTVSGLGDVSLSANYLVFKKEAFFPDEPASSAKDGKTVVARERGEPDFSATLNLSAGLKFPTGNTSWLKDNFNEVDVEGAPESGIGGHDLTLGTGSYDGIFGTQAMVRYKALFFQADAQFTWRGYGAYQYRFANDFSWSGGPGFYLIRRKNNSLALQCAISGETKGYDYFLGAPLTDTGITALYLGPRVTASLGRVSGEVAVDLPVIMNTTAFQTAPTYRIRAGFSVLF